MITGTNGWSDTLVARLSKHKDVKIREKLPRKYSQAFPEDYRLLLSIDEAEHDITFLESLSSENPVRVALSPVPSTEQGQFTLIVYSYGQYLTISRALPVLEHAGLEVINERSSCLTPEGSQRLFVHRFAVKARQTIDLGTEAFALVAAPGLESILAGKAEDDHLNSLMLTAQLSARMIALVRTYCSLLSQVNRSVTRTSILQIVAAAPRSATQLVRMFEALFKPASHQTLEMRKNAFAALLSEYRDNLRTVSDITKDRVLRSLALLLEHTVRTNFFKNTPNIAIKLRSEAIDILPQPRPLFEIFVSAPDVEGVHLRGSRVARGGLRWSERYDDYRFEVLGLMKTQKIKNAVIVPGGAKGGFVVKNMPADSALVPAAVQSAYSTFIRSLLSLTDNRVGAIVKHPEDLVIHDEQDPYFVVAADKGTATFSDIANRIATSEFNFWLGDAFASGGSNGYDHKLYGITAKGGWECVLRHFHDMSFDPNVNSFSAIGIGDMAGDVFGNGLILSRTVKLLGAFNHKHVFIDPNPDPESSFQERRRLFNLKSSQWSDYKPELISKGGGIYGRFDKEIRLSPEARKALSIDNDTPEVLNGEQVILLLLKAEVDLLWNGGIGTYIKASIESHSDVNDGANDRVRISAPELRAKVVGEGGNLGFTQRARVEFAQNGGRVNTDAIDNSGGVDLSDHEVNLKILFTGLIRDKKLTIEERNQLLKEMAPEVVEHVLEHNRSHALLLSLAVERSRRNMDYFQSLLREMSRLGYVNRQLEFLPDDEELRERAMQKAALTRPELAVCTAAVKLWVKDILLSSQLMSDPALQTYLLSYFPLALRTRFQAELLAHPLANNIVATQVANTLVDIMGITFVHRMCTNYSAQPSAVLKCALAAEMLLDARQVRSKLVSFDSPARGKEYVKAHGLLSRAMMDIGSWFISSSEASGPISKMVQNYQAGYRAVIGSAENILRGKESEDYQKRQSAYQSAGFDSQLSQQLALFPHMISVLELLSCAKQSGKDVKQASSVFFSVIDEFGVRTFLDQQYAPDASNKWESEVLLTSSDEIRRSVAHLTCRLLDMGCNLRESVSQVLRKAPTFDRVKNVVDEARTGTVSVASYAVIARQFRTFTLT